MADNTLLNSGTGGDTVRDLDRLTAGIKTQVVQLDFGGAATNAEQLVSSTNPLPVLTQNTATTAVSITTSTGTQAMATNGMSTVSLYLSSVGTGGTGVIEATVDGTNWTTQTIVTPTGYGTSISTTGLYQWTVTSFAQTRFRATALTSGTITGTMIAGPGAYQVTLDPTGAQTSANSTSVALATDQLTAASTQPVFTQAALTVADRSTGAINSTAPSSLQFVGGSYNSTLPTLTSGQMGALQLTTKGEQLVSLSNAGTAVVVTAASTQPAFASAALTVADRATGASASTAPSSTMQIGGIYNNTQPTVSNGNMQTLQLTSKAELLTTISNAGTAAVVTAASTAAATGSAALTVALSPNSPSPATTSSNQACSAYIANAVGSAVTVKSSGGNLFGFSLLNNNAANVFVEFFNTTSVTLGSTTPVAAYVIPASGALTLSPSDIAHFNNATAIAMAAVTAYNGSSTGSVTGTVFYK